MADAAAIHAEIARLHEALAAKHRELSQAEPASAGSPYQIGIEKAMERLDCSRGWLERRANWQKVGGYKDDDGRVKFPVAALEAHIQGQRR